MSEDSVGRGRAHANVHPLSRFFGKNVSMCEPDSFGPRSKMAAVDDIVPSAIVCFIALHNL